MTKYGRQRYGFFSIAILSRNVVFYSFAVRVSCMHVVNCFISIKYQWEISCMGYEFYGRPLGIAIHSHAEAKISEPSNFLWCFFGNSWTKPLHANIKWASAGLIEILMVWIFTSVFRLSVNSAITAEASVVFIRRRSLASRHFLFESPFCSNCSFSIEEMLQLSARLILDALACLASSCSFLASFCHIVVLLEIVPWKQGPLTIDHWKRIP